MTFPSVSLHCHCEHDSMLMFVVTNEKLFVKETFFNRVLWRNLCRIQWPLRGRRAWTTESGSSGEACR